MSNNKKLLYFFGRPFSPLYGAAMKIRSTLYQKGLLRSYHLPVPVISVGNLTMGGTGKTPMVAYLVEKMIKKGFSPAIISRGYGGKASEKINVVSNGKNILLAADMAGDEPRLLAELLPSTPVLTGIVRALPCRYAIDKLSCNLLILDDGFQHMAVLRDINLALFNANTLAGNSRVFPGGDLREPISSLNRADAFLITDVNDSNRKRADLFKELLKKRFPKIPTFRCSYRAESVLASDGQQLPLSGELALPFYGLCGIAQPKNFHQSLKNAGIQLTDFSELRDHHSYQRKDVRKIEERALASGAAGIITTEKDLVKLKLLPFTLPLYVLKMKVDAEKSLAHFIDQRLSAIGE